MRDAAGGKIAGGLTAAESAGLITAAPEERDAPSVATEDALVEILRVGSKAAGVVKYGGKIAGMVGGVINAVPAKRAHVVSVLPDERADDRVCPEDIHDVADDKVADA